jgi:hypothetical protein
MSRRIFPQLAALAVALAGAAASLGQGDKAKDPECKYALDLRARKSTEPSFTAETRKYGVEVFLDGHTSDALYLSEAGSVAVVPAKLFKAGDGKAKGPLWQHGLTLNARPASETKWEKGKKYGLEAYKDDNSGDLVYINENGVIATAPAKYAAATVIERGRPKDPSWKDAMNLKVRKAGEVDWDKAKKFGVEVFRDENNGSLIYITETGHFAVVPGKLGAKDDTGKGPNWQHGLELSVRKQGEKATDKDTKRYGVEVFLDENNGNQIYVTETGAVAVVPGKFAKPTAAGRSKDPTRKHGMDLRVRKAGQKEFDKDCPRYGVEVYADENNGNVIYLSETGDLAVISPAME